jgi:pilus assembly protein CpaB
MKTARLIVLAIAISAGGVAAYLASGSDTKTVVAEQAPQLPTIDVLVAKSDIALGQSVGPDEMQWQTWPASTASSSFIRRNDRPDATTQIAGSGFMAAVLPGGMRAVSTEISPETGAGGFILPNDRVDVILSKREKNLDRANAGDIVNSEVILSNVRVLAIDQAPREKDGQNSVVGKTATLELKPGQAEALARARQSGTISLALRSMVDASKPEAPRVEGSTDGLVTVFRGEERTVYSCTPMCKRGAGGG